jgi:hypothetical protein
VIGAMLVFALAVLLGALLRCLRPAVRGRDVYANGRRVKIMPLSAFQTPLQVKSTGLNWSTPLLEYYYTAVLEGVLLRGLEIRLTTEAARQVWRDETQRLREEAKHGRLGHRKIVGETVAK